jgi:hypothetical protein
VFSDVGSDSLSVGFFVQNANYGKFNVKLLLFMADLYIYFLREVFTGGMDAQKAL